MSKVRLTMDLPKVGDRLVRIAHSTAYGIGATFKPRECTVVYVNEPHHWYEVEFADSGVRECFGVPVIDHSIARGWQAGVVPVVCVETGMAYSTITQCSRDTGVSTSEISSQILGKHRSRSSLHFVKVL